MKSYFARNMIAAGLMSVIALSASIGSAHGEDQHLLDTQSETTFAQKALVDISDVTQGDDALPKLSYLRNIHDIRRDFEAMSAQAYAEVKHLREARERLQGRVTCFTDVRAMMAPDVDRTYFKTPKGLFQVLPENESITQIGDDVHFSGSRTTGFIGGDFTIEDVRLDDIIALYKDCRS